MRAFSMVLYCLLPALVAAPAASEPLRLQHIQVIGTHNSYHIGPNRLELAIMMAVTPRAKMWDYTHPPLDVQLERGVRSFELDLYWTTRGWEVYHVPLIGEGTTCRFLHQCLERVASWSAGNPGHVPISLLLEIKDSEAPAAMPPALPIGQAALLLLDGLLRDAFGGALLEPDEVRQGKPTLREAVETLGWPRLDEVRGGVLAILHERGSNRDAYLQGAASLEGRAMFVNSSEGAPHAATFVKDGPSDDAIPRLARQNYLIRTRADAGLVQAERGDTSRRDQALASGAHILSTDFPYGSMHPETGYIVAFEGDAPARCNPVTAPEACDPSTMLEHKAARPEP